MEQWQDAASQQVKLLTDRVTELLSKGLGLLRSELGVDLGLQPELIPSWVILLAACSGLVLMVALWASVCRALFKKRPAVRPADDGIEVKRGANKAFRSEEPKKKKKKADKKAQANGRAVAEPQEAAPVSEERVPHHQSPPPLQVKPEKAAEVTLIPQQTPFAANSTLLLQFYFPGTWETKVSNKEKREQRKKDKNSSDGSASPGRGETPVSVASEPYKASAAPAPAAQKKKKGGFDRVDLHLRSFTAEETTCRGPSSPEWMTSGLGSVRIIDLPLSMSLLTALFSFTASFYFWLLFFTLLFSGGLCLFPDGASVDPSSDWNAPSEAWGNYEEPTPEPPPTQEQPLPEPAKVNLLSRATVSTKLSIMGVTWYPEIDDLVERSVRDITPQKPPVTQVPQKPTDGEPTAKQNTLPAPTQQKKPDENQAPKPAKKKKARRET
uniref:Metadherin b n=1 Tax=Mastacembelus armatus TaxID=205130 RepID=A0A3Q3L8G7_9TELE